MASATGIPEHLPGGPNNTATETEPLLGGPGDAAQKQDAPLIRNLWLGTGWIAQAGLVLLIIDIWASVFLHPLIPLFSPHPLLQTLGLAALTQAILALQPTRTAAAKLAGQRVHGALQLLALLLFAAGVGIIEANKVRSGGAHFHSAHGYLGVVSAVLLVVQNLVGFSMWAVPAVFGGRERAGAVWKYHRWSGYVVYLLLLVTIVTATGTEYVEGVLHVRTWSVVVAAVLIVIGVYPRISLAKLGLRS